MPVQVRGEQKNRITEKLNRKKNNRKNRIEKNQINRLENHKTIPVRFGFGL